MAKNERFDLNRLPKNWNECMNMAEQLREQSLGVPATNAQKFSSYMAASQNPGNSPALRLWSYEKAMEIKAQIEAD